MLFKSLPGKKAERCSCGVNNVTKLPNGSRRVTLFPMSDEDDLRPGRLIYLILGWIFFSLGLLGALLPVVPATPFMLLAAWAFSKSSRRFEQWLLNNKYFGPSIVQFRAHRVIPLQAKIFSIAAMTVTLVASIASGMIPWWGLVGQTLLMGYATWFTLRCPSRAPDTNSSSSES